MDAAEQDLLAETLRKTMHSSTGAALDAALTSIGWPELLGEWPGVAIPLVFRLLGETGAHAPVLNDVLLNAAGRPVGGTLPLPWAGGAWVEWARTGGAGRPAEGAGGTAGEPAGSAGRPAGTIDGTGGGTVDGDLPLRVVGRGDEVPLAAGRLAVGWWLVGSGRAMLTLARAHALDRVQFGRPLAGFQAVRHRLAETLVALEGAEAVLAAAAPQDQAAAGGATAPDDQDGFGALLGKAAAGQAALTAARHCQQVLGGIGFTEEHPFHRHFRRVLVLDGLLGSSRELTREAGALVRARGSAPRLVNL